MHTEVVSVNSDFFFLNCESVLLTCHRHKHSHSNAEVFFYKELKIKGDGRRTASSNLNSVRRISWDKIRSSCWRTFIQSGWEQFSLGAAARWPVVFISADCSPFPSAVYYSRLIQMIPNIFIPGFCIYEVSHLLPVIESLAGGMHIYRGRYSIWCAISNLIRIKWAKKRSIKYQRCQWGFVSYLWKFMFSAVKVSASLPLLTWQPWRHRRGSLRPPKIKYDISFCFLWNFKATLGSKLGGKEFALLSEEENYHAEIRSFVQHFANTVIHLFIYF